jgi:hypothetical protein
VAIIYGIQIGLTVLAVVAAFYSYVWARSAAKEGREAKRLLQTLSALMHSFHGPGYPGPTAVVTPSPEPSPEPAPAVPPLPAPARVPDIALPLLREAAPQPPTVRPPPRKVSTRPRDPATITEAERSRALTIAMALPAPPEDPDNRPAIEQLPKANVEGDRESGEELTRVMVAGESSGVGLGPFPEPEEASRRRPGLYSIVTPDGPPAKPGEERAPITPTEPSRKG